MVFSRPTKLVVLAIAAIALLGLLVLSVRESRTIVVSATPSPNLSLTTPASGTLVGALVAPSYSGRSPDGTVWQLNAARADQLASGNSATHGVSGEINLTAITASFQQANQAPLTLASPFARYQPQATHLQLPQGVTLSGTLAGYKVAMQAAWAQAVLNSTTLNLAGGVSATLWPR
jgi:hypothetical protein